MPNESRHEMRRVEDQTMASVLTYIADILHKWRALGIVFVTLVGGVAGASAWIATQNAMHMRVGKLETRVDSGFKAIDGAIGDVRAAQDSIKITREATDEKIDLLLRLNCATVPRADLLRACRSYVPAGGN